MKYIFCFFQSFLILISSFSVYDSSFKKKVDRSAMELTSITDFEFESISAEEIAVSESEKKLCREWYENNILTDENPAYNFTVGGKNFRRNISDWDIAVGKEGKAGEKYPGGKTSIITVKHKKSALEFKVEATIYEELATCKWFVTAVNKGNENSPVIKNFYAADCKVNTGTADIYFSKGSLPAADDFELMKSPLQITPMVFNANGGRSSSWLPYFNVCGEDFGFVAATGWTGQWYSSLQQKKNATEFKTKQEFFNTYLLPGESIRSPLVSFTFYKNKNALKGFNSFRDWELNCVYPESVKPLNGFVIANEFSKLTCNDFIDMINRIDKTVLDNTDYFWMDAGWYKYNEGWHDGVGNWIPDSDRFPEGMKPMTDLIKEKGKKFLLWFEPERVRENTSLYNEAQKHKGWIVQIGSDLMWNLGNDDACDYLSDMISTCLVENGVTMYRQDFNFDPLKYWQKADKDFCNNRKGITENHYVTNLYRYLDALCESVPGLIIDNCSSGGKRLDIEMSARSIPLWRSDYNCGNADGTVKSDVLEATQSMTYGLAFWMPYSGTNRYFHSEYASRSCILTNQSVYEPDPVEYIKYKKISESMTENYYPLVYGGTSATSFLGMQFGSEKDGYAIIYKREKVSENSCKIKLNGLEKSKNYTVYNFDNGEIIASASGESLMNNGINAVINETPKAYILNYRADF